MSEDQAKYGVLLKGDMLRKILKQMNLTQSEFAKKCRITPSYFSLFISEKKEPNPATRRRIMKQINKFYPELKWADIFYFEDEVPLESNE
jgi:transcriptional regulator with XRE-family HTH domain